MLESAIRSSVDRKSTEHFIQFPDQKTQNTDGLSDLLGFFDPAFGRQFSFSFLLRIKRLPADSAKPEWCDFGGTE